MKYKYTLILILFCCLASSYAAVYEVGAGTLNKLPSQVMSKVADGDTVLIDSGTYSGDVGNWTKNNLFIRGIGGYAHLDANGKSAGGKAIWVVQGNNTTIENIEFSGATVTDKNGAGIRQEGINLTIRHCYFHDNEDGILAGDNPTSTILIEFSEFARNGYGDGYSHNMYINHIKKFTLQFSYTHNAIVGHCVKSRAYNSYILYNRIMDEDTGSASMLVDLPNGGVAYVIGNEIMKGANAQNPRSIEFGVEGLINPDNQLYVANNTMVTTNSNSNFIFIQPGTSKAQVMNNIMIGPGTPLSGFLPDTASNVHYASVAVAGLTDPTNYDYRLLSSSPVIDKGTDPGNSNTFSLLPTFEYKHPTDSLSRIIYNKLDIGAYEYNPPTDIQEITNSNDEITIYPNPVSDLLNITHRSGIEISNISIVDVLGNEKMTLNENYLNSSGNKITLNIKENNISPGLYYCKILSGNGVIVKSIVILK